MKENEMREVANLLDRVMDGKGQADVTSAVREDVKSLCAKFPLWH